MKMVDEKKIGHTPPWKCPTSAKNQRYIALHRGQQSVRRCRGTADGELDQKKILKRDEIDGIMLEKKRGRQVIISVRNFRSISAGEKPRAKWKATIISRPGRVEGKQPELFNRKSGRTGTIRGRCRA